MLKYSTIQTQRILHNEKKIRNQDIFLLHIKIRKKLQDQLLGYTGACHKIQHNANVITFINNHNILMLT